MARRNLSLFKKTAVEPEIVDETPASLEIESGAGGGVLVQYDSALDEAPPGFVKPLTAAETKRRAELERLINQNMGAFLAVGYALREIQDNGLYRTTHRNFSDYCKDIWEIARCRAYQLINAANVVDNLKQIDLSTICRQNEPVLRNEGQARALAKFDPEQQRTIWTEAVQTSPNGKVTASHIKKTAKRLHLEKVAKTVQRTKYQTRKAPKISENFGLAFTNFLDAINEERANEYKNTDQKEVIRHVRIILEALEAEL